MKTINIEELIELLRLPGRYEVVSAGENNFIVIPICKDAIVITTDSHKEAAEHFLCPS